MKNILNFINKYPKKRVIAVSLCAVLVILLAVLPVAASKNADTEGYSASILSGTVEKGDVNTVLIGAGTLSQQTSEKINIPSTVKIKSFEVSNGDTVKKGDTLMKTDKVTLMKAISDVQETMDYIREEMENAKGESSTDKVTAQRAGTVKAVYAKKGDDVQSVMLKKGALLVLSLDGLMSVEIETEKELSAGQTVKVIFKDKTEVSGQVKTFLDGVAKITFEDDGFEEGTKVTVKTEKGKKIGSGKIEINSRWNATAYSGTISSVNVSAGNKVPSGKTLFSLENVSSTAKYDSLASKHREYEELMLSLFEIYQSGTVKAPSDGIVSGIDKESTLLLSNTEGVTVELLANSPDGNDEISYNNYIGKITAVSEGVWAVKLNGENQPVTDYKNLLGVDFAEEKMTENGNFNPTVPVYELIGNEWKQIEVYEIKAGDTLLFAGTGTSDIVWAVRIMKGSGTAPEMTTAPIETEPSSSEPTTAPDNTQSPTSPSMPSGSDVTMPSGSDVTMPSGSDVTMPSDSDVTMPSGGDVTMPSGSDVTMPSGGDVTMPSGSDVTMPSGSDMTMPSGSDITMPSGGDMTMPSGSDVTMPSGGDMTMPSGSDVTMPSGDTTMPSGQQSGQSQMPGGSFSGGSFSGGSFSGGSFSGGSFSGGSFAGIQSGVLTEEEEFELFDLEGTTVAEVTPLDSMTLSVTVDELDLSSLKTGMKAEITLDAFMGEAFEGTVTDIGTSGENSGGNSKFQVEISMDRAENMLSGMNATAKIVLDTKKDVLTVPVEALCDEGNKTVIYTRYNKGDETLEKPVTVTVGASDGETAEITSGLSEGQEYYYSYYDEYQSSESTGGFSFGGFGGMSGMGNFGGMGGGRPGR